MPSLLLKREFTAGQYYHLMHTAKPGTSLFQEDADYKNFILLLSYYLRFPDATPLSWVKRLNPKTVIAKRDASTMGAAPVTLHAYLLLPDHFHLVLRENIGGKSPGISNLMRRLSVGYAMFYNKAHEATGTIYRGKYKNIAIIQDQLGGLINTLHHHPSINATYLSQPLVSSRTDYNGQPRPWLTPIPLSDNPIPNKIILCKSI